MLKNEHEKKAQEIVDRFEKLKQEAIDNGSPISFDTTGAGEVVLYYNEDYPDKILVDKGLLYLDRHNSKLYQDLLDIAGNLDFIDYKDIMKSYWTSYCFSSDMEVDTLDYDNDIREIFNLATELDAKLDYEYFYNFMSEFLV